MEKRPGAIRAKCRAPLSQALLCGRALSALLPVSVLCDCVMRGAAAHNAEAGTVVPAPLDAQSTKNPTIRATQPRTRSTLVIAWCFFTAYGRDVGGFNWASVVNIQ